MAYFRGGGYRGGQPALKPEGALKRADELLGVGQKQNALQTLHDTITNKRQQRNWTKALEQVRGPAEAPPGPGAAVHVMLRAPCQCPGPCAPPRPRRS